MKAILECTGQGMWRTELDDDLYDLVVEAIKMRQMPSQRPKIEHYVAGLPHWLRRGRVVKSVFIPPEKKAPPSLPEMLIYDEIP